jgi:hypothetical protein
MVQYIENLTLIVDSNLLDQISLPTQFEYNEGWIGKHECISCKNIIILSPSILKDQGMLWEKKKIRYFE